MIGLELTVRCETNQRVEFLPTLQNLSKESSGGGSGSECRVFEELGHANRFLWLQWWRSEKELETYLKSEGFRTLMGAIKVLGRLDVARIVELQDSTSILGAFLGDRFNVSNQLPGV
jgi:quinol monooxygenase YgiN